MVASRYAKSLLDLAIENNQLEVVRVDMLLVSSVCANNHEFVKLLESPVIKIDKKLAIFKSIFEGKVSKVTSSFLNLIAAKRRESYIYDIAKSFDEQYKLFKNITTVKVKSAIALDAELKDQILGLVKKSVTGEIELIEKTDPSLIGGFVLTINDSQLDQSVKRKLNDLRKSFSGSGSLPGLN